MFKVALVNMPFSAVTLPSLGLTQLRAAVDRALSATVHADLYYLNHDVACYLGPMGYKLPGRARAVEQANIGEWLFRHAAFPNLPDNTQQYISRFSHLLSSTDRSVLQELLHRRPDFANLLHGLIDRYHLDRYDLVGFTLLFSQGTASIALARLLKERNPRQVIVFGGAHCDAPMGSVLARNIPAIDYVCCGPALVSFPTLVQHLAAGRPQACDDIRGVLSRRKLATRGPQCIHEIGEDLDINTDLTLDYEGFLGSVETKFPPGGVTPLLFFETSRGCWWGQRGQCTFCGLNGSDAHYRFMHPQRALAQFDHLFRYHPRCSHFSAVDNVCPKEYFSSLFPRLRPPPGATLYYEFRVDVTDAQMDTLARAGIARINPGIEALNTSSLRLMHKGTNAFQNIRFLKNCARLHFRCDWQILLGSLGEREAVYEKYLQDLPRLLHLHPPATIGAIHFDRYSRYFLSARDYGLQLKPADSYALVYPFTPADLEDYAYFFQDSTHSYANNPLLQSWYVRLRAMNRQWWRRWDPTCCPIAPELTASWADGTLIVRDTRAEVAQPHEHRLDATDASLLAILESPSDLPHLRQRLPHADPEDIARRVGRLYALDLLFQEDGRYISLVVGGVPPHPSDRPAPAGEHDVPEPLEPQAGPSELSTTCRSRGRGDVYHCAN